MKKKIIIFAIFTLFFIWGFLTYRLAMTQGPNVTINLMFGPVGCTLFLVPIMVLFDQLGKNLDKII